MCGIHYLSVFLKLLYIYFFSLCCTVRIPNNSYEERKGRNYRGLSRDVEDVFIPCRLISSALYYIIHNSGVRCENCLFISCEFDVRIVLFFYCHFENGRMFSRPS